MQERVEFLQVLCHGDGLDPDELNTSMDVAKHAILTKIRDENHCDAADATHILQMLATSPLQGVARIEIGRELNNLVTRQGLQSGGRQGLQSCAKVNRYLPQDLWEMLGGECQYGTKLALYAEFIGACLGLAFANAFTYIRMTGTFIMATRREEPDILSCDKYDAHTILVDLKRIIRSSRKRQGPHARGQILLYPSSPCEFHRQYPEAFKIAYKTDDINVLPFHSPIDESMLDTLCSRLPSRSTHSSISASKSPLKMGGILSQNVCNRMMLQMFQRANEDGLPDLPGFRMLGGNATRRLATRSLPSPEGAVMADSKLANTLKGTVDQSPSGAVMGTILDGPAEEGIQTPVRQEPKEEEPKEEPMSDVAKEPKKDVAAMTQCLLNVLAPNATKKPTPKKQAAPKKNAKPKMAVKKDPAPKVAVKKDPAPKEVVKKAALKFTQPKAGAATVCVGKYSIRVDMPSMVWRVTGPNGTTRCASFKVDAKAGWGKVLAMVK